MIIIMIMTMVTAGTITIITLMGTATIMFTLITMTTPRTGRGCSIAAPIRLVKRSPA